MTKKAESFNLAKLDGENTKLVVSMFHQDDLNWFRQHTTALIQAINGIAIDNSGNEVRMPHITKDGTAILNGLWEHSSKLSSKKKSWWKIF